MLQVLFLVFVNLVSCLHFWEIDHLVGPEAIINHVIVWKNKAYLCVPRRENSLATLLIAPWPEGNKFTSAVLPFPSFVIQSLDKETNILSAVGGDVDPRGFLFILDVGMSRLGVHPKIMIFYLPTWNFVSRVALPGAPSTLSSLVLDPISSKTMVYIADPENQRLILFNQRDRKWWPVQLKLFCSYTGQPIQSPDVASNLAVSKTSNELFMTSNKATDLYSLDLTSFRHGTSPPDILCNNLTVKMFNMTIQNMGLKLGKSSGLLADYSGRVHYYLLRFYATVLWDSRYPLEAESHTVTGQSMEELPGVSSFFLDSQRQVWAVLKKNNSSRNDGATCVKINPHRFDGFQ